MPLIVRLAIYILCLAGGLAAGRYLVPSGRSLLDAEPSGPPSDAGAAAFWSEKVSASLNAESPADRTVQFLSVLGKCQADDFPHLAAAASDDPLAAKLAAARWAETFPSGFYKYLATRGLKTATDHEMAAVLLHAWAQKDLPSATAAASRLRVLDAPLDARLAIFYALMQSDIRRGLEFMAQNKIQVPAPRLLPWLKLADPAAAAWKGIDLSGKIEFFQHQPASEWRTAALEALHEQWLRQDPKAVLISAQQTGLGAQLIPQAVAALMERDANEVSRFFQTEARDAVKAQAGLALARRVATADPQQAWDFAQWFLSGAPRAQACESVIDAVAQSSPADAAVRLRDVPDSPWRRRAAARLARKWHAADPAAAMQWLETSLKGGAQKAAASALAEDASLTEEARREIRRKFHLPEDS
jgi:hypothetical protein